MNTWLVIILVWIGLGGVVLGVERALRGTAKNSLIDSLDSVLFALAMLIVAPFLLAYVIALVVSQPFVTLWRGSIPFVDKPWWPARAKTFEIPRAERSQDNSILSQMIRLREGAAPPLRRRPRWRRYGFMDCRSQ